jgi:hypothetical protein
MTIEFQLRPNFTNVWAFNAIICPQTLSFLTERHTFRCSAHTISISPSLVYKVISMSIGHGTHVENNAYVDFDISRISPSQIPLSLVVTGNSWRMFTTGSSTRVAARALLGPGLVSHALFQYIDAGCSHRTEDTLVSSGSWWSLTNVDATWLNPDGCVLGKCFLVWLCAQFNFFWKFPAQ